MMPFECVGLFEARVTNGYKTLWAYWEPCLCLLKDLQIHVTSDYLPSSLIYVLTLLISFIFTTLLKYFIKEGLCNYYTIKCSCVEELVHSWYYYVWDFNRFMMKGSRGACSWKLHFAISSFLFLFPNHHR